MTAANDIWKLALDGSGDYERITYFNDAGIYKGTNPVISDDGRYMAFQVPKVFVEDMRKLHAPQVSVVVPHVVIVEIEAVAGEKLLPRSAANFV